MNQGLNHIFPLGYKYTKWSALPKPHNYWEKKFIAFNRELKRSLKNDSVLNQHILNIFERK